jgi:uroporphyrinogen decarboxylase
VKDPFHLPRALLMAAAALERVGGVEPDLRDGSSEGETSVKISYPGGLAVLKEMTMTNHERMLACIRRENDDVLYWPMGFFNRATAARLMGDVLYDSYYFLPTTGAYGFAPLAEAERERLLAFNRALGKCAVGLGHGGNSSFGHGGPGEFNGTVYDADTAGFRVRYETGAIHQHQRTPHNYHIMQLPMAVPEDWARPELPDPDVPERWRGLAEDAAWFKARGEFTFGNLNGFFSALHYYFLDYPETLMGFLAAPDCMHNLLRRLGEWNLAAARHMLEAGVDCVVLCDDLGSNDSMLVSPAVYREFIKPWHTALNCLVHSYPDRFCHLHSHGNIMPIIPDLVEAGFDLLNPLDPTDGIDLVAVKREYGCRLTLVGGLPKQFFTLAPGPMEQVLRETLAVCRPGGGFILMEASGVPDTVSQDTWRLFRAMIAPLRRNV